MRARRLFKARIRQWRIDVSREGAAGPAAPMPMQNRRAEARGLTVARRATRIENYQGRTMSSADDDRVPTTSLDTAKIQATVWKAAGTIIGIALAALVWMYTTIDDRLDEHSASVGSSINQLRSDVRSDVDRLHDLLLAVVPRAAAEQKPAAPTRRD